jgi:uncharacterized delta-60 repeat protein
LGAAEVKSLAMKKTATILSWLICICTTIWGQVPDSTFGEPFSFLNHPDLYFAGVTGCDFDGRDDRAYAALHLDDGKILLAGHTEGPDGVDFALVRLMPDGKYDSTAGTGGRMRIDIGYRNDSCIAATRYLDQHILMGGAAFLPGQHSYVNLIARLDFNGQLDPTFGNGGHAIIDLPSVHEMITKIITLPDGKILIAGNAYYGSSYFYVPDSTAHFVGRLLPDGQVDSTFGAGGFVFRGSHDQGDCMAPMLGDVVVAPDGRIVVSGNSFHTDPGQLSFSFEECPNYIFIYHYLPDGQPDPTFGDNGMVELALSSGRSQALLIEEDGKILVTGGLTFGFWTRPYTAFWDRLLPDGRPDPTFGDGGRFFANISGSVDLLASVSTLKIGHAYYAGWVGNPGGHAFGLLRLTAEGQLDSSFVQSDFGNAHGLVFTSWDWLPFGGDIHHASTTDSLSIFLVGTYRTLFFGTNMMIAKVKLPPPAMTNVFSELLPVQRLRVFPNPVEGGRLYFEFEYAAPLGMTALHLSDMQGRSIVSRPYAAQSGRNELDIIGLPPGMYVLELRSSSGRWVGKVAVPR